MSRRGWLLFTAMGLIWGIPYLLIKVAVDEVTPVCLVFLRTMLAALLLLPLAIARGHLRPVLVRWRIVLLFALVELGIPWLLLNQAEQTLSSSLAGLLIATVPLVGAMLGWLTGQERLGQRRIAGLVIGFAGVAALVGFNLTGANLPALIKMMVVAIGYAVGPFLISRYMADLPNLGVITVALGMTALAYLPLGVIQLPRSMPSLPAVGAILTLAVICTAVAFVVFFALIAEVGPVRSTVVTYVNPAVAVVLGAVLLGEKITIAIVAGFLLVLAGSILATLRPPVSREDHLKPPPGWEPAPLQDEERAEHGAGRPQLERSPWVPHR